MNRNDFKNPLIQSGAVLLVVFLLISIVANSGAHGIIGSIGALFSGLISGVLFIIALCLAIIISIAIIIGLFIAAVSIHSVDKAKDLYQQLKTSLLNFYSKIAGKTRDAYTQAGPQTIRQKVAASTEQTAPTNSPAAVVPDEKTARRLDDIASRIKAFEATVSGLQAHSDETAGQIKALQSQVTLIAEKDLATVLDGLAQKQDNLASQLTELSAGLQANTAKLEEVQSSFSEERKRLQVEIEELREKTSIPEIVSGILSYIDLPEDREIITKKAEEAVSRGMTYSQIDEFFKSSLKPAVYKTLQAHPRLTKDFIRSIKKKFA